MRRRPLPLRMCLYKMVDRIRTSRIQMQTRKIELSLICTITLSSMDSVTTLCDRSVFVLKFILNRITKSHNLALYLPTPHTHAISSNARPWQLCELRYESVAVGPEGELIYSSGADYEVQTGFQTISGSSLLSHLHLKHARQLLISDNNVEIRLSGRFSINPVFTNAQTIQTTGPKIKKTMKRNCMISMITVMFSSQWRPCCALNI